MLILLSSLNAALRRSFCAYSVALIFRRKSAGIADASPIIQFSIF